MREFTIRHHVAGMEFVGVDKSARCGKGGHYRSGRVVKCLWQMCSRQVESHQQYVRSNHVILTHSSRFRTQRSVCTPRQKCNCRRKRRDNGEITARQRRNSATVALWCDSLTFMRQCGQVLTRRSIEGKHDGDRFERLRYEWTVSMPVYNDGWRLCIRVSTPFWAISISGSLHLNFLCISWNNAVINND